jgi:hypothetical protein
VLNSMRMDSEEGRLSIEGATPNIDSVAVVLASFIQSDDHDTIFREGRLSSVNRDTRRTPEGEEVVRYNFSADILFNPSVLRN